jgi:beta-mannosidase
VLNTAGPWRPVWLEVSSAHINDFILNYSVSPDLEKVQGTVEVDIEGLYDRANVSIRFQDDVVYTTAAAKSSDGRLVIPFAIGTQPYTYFQGLNINRRRLDHPKLWYPAGYGHQSQYSVSVSIVKDSQELDVKIKKTGFRRSELVQNDDSHGKSFFFRINNIDIFCGGSCWIPADNFLPRITTAKYRNWLKLMIQGNQIMTR